jgi:hypothetical protein
MKCKHGLTAQTCAICKDWPSLEKMQISFPSLSNDMFLAMTPSERLEAIRSGRLESE